MRKINGVKKIYIDRASEYIEITYKDGRVISYNPSETDTKENAFKCEVIFENDERPIAEIIKEQASLGRIFIEIPALR